MDVVCAMFASLPTKSERSTNCHTHTYTNNQKSSRHLIRVGLCVWGNHLVCLCLCLALNSAAQKLRLIGWLEGYICERNAARYTWRQAQRWLWSKKKTRMQHHNVIHLCCLTVCPSVYLSVRFSFVGGRNSVWFVKSGAKGKFRNDGRALSRRCNCHPNHLNWQTNKQANKLTITCKFLQRISF